MIRVLIADDHPVVRQGLRTFLDLQDDITVVGEAADGEQAVALVAELGPDVLLLDLKMPVLDGLGALRRLSGSATRAIVLTSVSDRSDVGPALRAGAAGFLYKDVAPGALVQAVRTVHGGQVLLAPEAAEAMLTPSAGPAATGPAPLTEREREVLTLIAAGRSNREIARSLAVAEKTVKTHVSNVLMKLGVQDRTQAALYAVRHGLA
ncbi:DNA-binding response regulator, NarL/FixJ family, contains REC and HTH domains [Nonomuraea maritima]|uniref:DNA-binding response regulator, NarL/FixJ family, contains REC and HTH domains n=1 Tax=Nonomuraea maritima TaxID=683260 RepID=A0A1G9LA61_9ACTN|nr:response regulator transcription factor [Nonomuraea maritima]SDL58445.1 DNA-binding response regulator, NarL/FixJ family, contains REC and HTH domains [Nonomuraea maritima]